MDVFKLNSNMLADYESYIRSFIKISDDRIAQQVDQFLEEGNLWPEALIQLNPAFESGGHINELVEQGLLHPQNFDVFKIQKADYPPGNPIRLHRHQTEAIKAAQQDKNYVLTTGTGSGKSLAYVIPIVDYVLRNGSGQGIKAIIIYPMNALVNSQENELRKFLCEGFPDEQGPVTFRAYTGQNDEKTREEIRKAPPDILLTNYMMMELLLTRDSDRAIISKAVDLKFLVLDELHTYRGRQGSDVAMMVRRLRELCGQESLRCIGTSATLAGQGTYDQQRNEVARVASLLFGAPVDRDGVIMETLRRTTADFDPDDANFKGRLTDRVANYAFNQSLAYEDLYTDPLYSWLESTLGVTIKDGRLVRQKPLPLRSQGGLADQLGQITGLEIDSCIAVLEDALLAGYNCRIPKLLRPALAFRLHQFISRGDTVYVSLEDQDKRHITFSKQQYAPGADRKVLLPLGFCRECGQEYYIINYYPKKSEQGRIVEGRGIYESIKDAPDDALPGFLYCNPDSPWPTEDEDIVNRIPDDWLEDGTRVKRSQLKNLPQSIWVNPQGEEDKTNGKQYILTRAPFRFCLKCGVSYSHNTGTDVPKLASLNVGGRSSATTVLSLSSVRNLRQSSLPAQARKLLSFTDNRQDASLQAGHFNDFVDVGMLRAAIYKAMRDSTSAGLMHQELTAKVFDALNLPFEVYASNPGALFATKLDTEESLRAVLGYRIYCDLRRGWRVNMPNLEQCGLLRIEYLSLKEVCVYQQIWETKHPALLTADPETRESILRVLLDYMRRELAIKVDYLRREQLEQIVQRSNQRLKPPWGIDENEANHLIYATTLFPCTKPPGRQNQDDYVYLSEYSGFAQYLTRYNTLPNHVFTSKRQEAKQIIAELLDVLVTAGLVEVVMPAQTPNQVNGYQITAANMIWKAGEGTEIFHDPLRVPNQSQVDSGGNQFFLDYYQRIALENIGIMAKEHTAQVPTQIRIEREDLFKSATLPILYCSPTMELGVDIAELNLVNMRNIPPTPANYAQRSGRAGRQGQPALVFSYCTSGSPHDQYFFRRPGLMVDGAVTPPRLDLSNEDLLRSHVQAMWLTVSGLSLGKSLPDVVDIIEDSKIIPLKENVLNVLKDATAKQKAEEYARKVLAPLEDELKKSIWYEDGWLNKVLNELILSFEDACKRWRTLYLSAVSQRAVQNAVIGDHTRSAFDHKQAKRLRAEAEAQIDLLTGKNEIFSDDFYSYRYMASEGFLPGYNFARLPLSAYIAGRKTAKNGDEYISRARFLAISEFGPRSLIYHEGSRYQVNRVLLPIDRLAGEELPTSTIKICPQCGYLHVLQDGPGNDLCERCRCPLELSIKQLFKMQNVSTKRSDRITSDEEERSRQGFELLTVIRFAERAGEILYRFATVNYQDQIILKLFYGQGATIWRINKGRRRRKNKNKLGFTLDIERGYWVADPDEAKPHPEDQDPVSNLQKSVIPYVEDRRNCLLLEPTQSMGVEFMASLQAALRRAIQINYQLEENEVAVEPLPTADNRNLLLIYEASEGGAGVLRRLVDEAEALPELARAALEICHYDPATGEDKRHAHNSKEDCESACYDCLMSYSNQLDHLYLHREMIKPFLEQIVAGQVLTSPNELSRDQHLQQLMGLAGSGLEKKWLELLERLGCKLPSRSQVLIPECGTRPDFIYDEPSHVIIYIDGPPHDYPDRQDRDRQQQDALEDMGYQVLRFHHEQDWEKIIRNNPDLFGISTN